MFQVFDRATKVCGNSRGFIEPDEHDLDESAAQHLGDYRYVPCTRCPVRVRKKNGG